MDKKKIFTLTGVIATIIAISSTAIACHFNIKKNAEQKKSDVKQEEPQQPSENTKNKNEQGMEYKTMYGIPSPFIDNEKNKDKYYDPNGENAVIEKYGLPPILEEDKIVKYAVPPLLKYAAPPFLNDPVDEPVVQPMYAVPDPKNIKEEGSSDSSGKNQNPWK